MRPFYDPSLTYEQNYVDGPFGELAQPASGMDAAEPRQRFVGLAVREPFGIPAGPLLNKRFTTAAFSHGYDICVYKTVRTGAHPCNPFPHVLAVHVDGDLTPERAMSPLLADGRFSRPISISNSFGVPSRAPDVWQPDMARAVNAAGVGQILVGSFQGTRGGGSERAYIADHVRAAQLVVETGAPVLEVNLSCPNEGVAALLCFDTPRVVRIVAAIKEEIGDLPLVVKVAYFADDHALQQLVSATAPYVAGFSAINTIPARLVDGAGSPALPGAGREVSGVCGAAIRWAGLEMTHRLRTIREHLGAHYEIIGVGGVASPDDYRAYREAGADAVMSATGAMWDAGLAARIHCMR